MACIRTKSNIKNNNNSDSINKNLISSKDLEAIARNTLKCGGIGPKIVSAPSESKDIDRVSIARKGIKKLIAAL